MKLSAELRKRFPAMELLRFCNSGTEANLLAMATARAVSRKDTIMIFNGAYHGSVFYFSHGPSPLNMPFPVITSTFNDPEKAASDIAKHGGKLAAVIVEPMQGGAGALPATPAFIAALRDVTERHGVLLIFDEVMTSRVHFGGLQAYFGVKPDLVTLGKYIAGAHHWRVWRAGRHHAAVRSVKARIISPWRHLQQQCGGHVRRIRGIEQNSHPRDD